VLWIVTTDEILDQILVPRPGGSEALERVASFIAGTLHGHGAVVSFHEFTGTPHGFQVTWTVVLCSMLFYVGAIARRRYGLALLLPLVTSGLLLLEFEWLRSPVSGWLAQLERNVVGTFPGRPGGGTLLFSAHYDTTTHFGDHHDWGAWGFAQGPAVALAVGLASAGLWRRRRGAEIRRRFAVPAALLAVTPFAAMAWFQSLGPILREPSPGAVDNGGSVAVLLRLAGALENRPAGAPTTVKLVFFAAEEERALGSWAFAQTLHEPGPLAVVNLEGIGGSDELAYISEDGFALVRYESPAWWVDRVAATAQDLWGTPLPAREIPRGVLTDGRSFLAHDVPALTLRAFSRGEFPHDLHSASDSRERLSLPAIDRGVELLRHLVRRADADPSSLRPPQPGS
jgi:acetylornithine deacetylase/succinyl-diaminopimelate desuccinylase-like protein